MTEERLTPIAERLKTIRPSQELLEFYRGKINEFDGEHADMLAKLERFRGACDDHQKMSWQIAQREEEIRELQQALSDMQVYLFQERDHVLRLYAENDRLKIRELEDRKRIQKLLELTQPVEHEATYFRTGKEPELIQRPQQQQQQKKGKKESHSSPNPNQHQDLLSDKDQIAKLVLTVESLQAQLQDQARLAKEQVAGLMEDRRVRAEEHAVLMQRDSRKVQELTERLHATQNILHDSTREFLELKFDARRKERGWAEEKEGLLQRISDLKDDIDRCHQNEVDAAQAIASLQAQVFRSHQPRVDELAGPGKKDVGVDVYRAGGRFDTRSMESLSSLTPTQDTGMSTRGQQQIEKQRSEFQDSLADMYREQCIELENELARVRGEKEYHKEISGDRTKKLLQKIALLNTKYEALENRRLLEVEGYKNDIRLLREQLKGLEKQLYRLTVDNTGNDTADRVLKSVHTTAKRSKSLLGELQHLKTKVYDMEDSVRHLQDP